MDKQEWEADVAKAGGLFREVVAKRVAIIAVITIVLNLAISYGWVTSDLSNEVLKFLGVIFDAAAAIATVAVVRPAVTPLTDPRDSHGNSLVAEPLSVHDVVSHHDGPLIEPKENV